MPVVKARVNIISHPSHFLQQLLPEHLLQARLGTGSLQRALSLLTQRTPRTTTVYDGETKTLRSK